MVGMGIYLSKYYGPGSLEGRTAAFIDATTGRADFSSYSLKVPSSSSSYVTGGNCSPTDGLISQVTRPGKYRLKAALTRDSSVFVLLNEVEFPASEIPSTLCCCPCHSLTCHHHVDLTMMIIFRSPGDRFLCRVPSGSHVSWRLHRRHLRKTLVSPCSPVQV